MLEHRFHAMGTEIELHVDARPSSAAERALGEAEAEFLRLEAVLSRFEDDSELSRLNRFGSLVVGRDLLELVRVARDARSRTRGRFDPTVLRALVTAGYDRSFEDVPLDGAAVTGGTRCGGGITIDRAASRVTLDEGVELDLGGIAKGYAADRVASALDVFGPTLVNAGGDIAVSRPPAAGCWPIGVETAEGQIVVGLETGGLATSGRDRRRWSRGGEEHHHLIDPARGRPSTSDILRVTAIASATADAEVMAKALFLAGSEAAREESDRLGVPSVIVTRDRRTLLAGGMR
jgi:thiamine biosynthesis lipoprotein